MKRVLSMLLVLVMTLSLVSAVSLVSYAEETTGTVVVFAQLDYSNLGVEANGNTYGRNALTFTASNLVTKTADYLGKSSKWDKPTGYGLTVRDGRVYNWSWDSAFFVEPEGTKYPAPLSVSSSGLRNIKNVTRYQTNKAQTGDSWGHVGNKYYGTPGDESTKVASSTTGVLNESTDGIQADTAISISTLQMVEKPEVLVVLFWSLFIITVLRSLLLIPMRTAVREKQAVPIGSTVRVIHGN